MLQMQVCSGIKIFCKKVTGIWEPPGLVLVLTEKTSSWRLFFEKLLAELQLANHQVEAWHSAWKVEATQLPIFGLVSGCNPFTSIKQMCWAKKTQLALLQITTAPCFELWNQWQPSTSGNGLFNFAASFLHARPWMCLAYTLGQFYQKAVFLALYLYTWADPPGE